MRVWYVADDDQTLAGGFYTDVDALEALEDYKPDYPTADVFEYDAEMVD